MQQHRADAEIQRPPNPSRSKPTQNGTNNRLGKPARAAVLGEIANTTKPSPQSSKPTAFPASISSTKHSPPLGLFSFIATQARRTPYHGYFGSHSSMGFPSGSCKRANRPFG